MSRATSKTPADIRLALVFLVGLLGGAAISLAIGFPLKDVAVFTGIWAAIGAAFFVVMRLP